MTDTTCPPPPRIEDAKGGFSRSAALALGLCFLMEQLDTAAVSVAIPEMARGFGVAPAQMGLVVTIYMLTLAAFIPASGWVADRFGARRVLMAAICVFVGGSLVAAMAQSFPQIIGARVLQGLGGAMMAPVGRLLLLRTIPRAELVRGIALMTTPALLGPLIGPLLGGLAVDHGSWRLIFVINLPISLGLLITLRRLLPPQRPLPVGRLDLQGLLLCAFALFSLQIAADTLAGGLMPPRYGWIAFAGALAAGAGYLWHGRRTLRPILRIGLFRRKRYRIGVLVGGLGRIGLAGVTFLLPLQFQIAFGFSALQTGSLILLTAAGALAVKAVTAPLIRRLGYRRFLALNSLLAATAIAAFAVLDAETPLPVIGLLLLVFGALRSLQFNATNALSYSDLPQRRQNAGATLASVMQQLSMALGTTMAASLVGIFAAGADYGPGFLVLAAFPAVAALGYGALAKS